MKLHISQNSASKEGSFLPHAYSLTLSKAKYQALGASSPKYTDSEARKLALAKSTDCFDMFVRAPTFARFAIRAKQYFAISSIDKLLFSAWSQVLPYIF